VRVIPVIFLRDEPGEFDQTVFRGQQKISRVRRNIKRQSLLRNGNVFYDVGPDRAFELPDLIEEMLFARRETLALSLVGLYLFDVRAVFLPREKSRVKCFVLFQFGKPLSSYFNLAPETIGPVVLPAVVILYSIIPDFPGSLKFAARQMAVNEHNRLFFRKQTAHAFLYRILFRQTI
jgi:hypothetical protein